MHSEYLICVFKYCIFPIYFIGYRLAFNFLKAHRYLEAVEVCHQVLGKHPAYPPIKKDILEKLDSS